jgi:hypothetical protein
MKAPQSRISEAGTPTFFLVAVRSGAETHIPCDAALYERVNGRDRAKGPHTGYDNLRDYGFVVWHDDGGRALDVDRINLRLQEYPEKTYSEADEAQTTVDVEFTKAGTIHVTKTVVGVSKPDLFQLVKDLNGITHLEVDQKVNARFEVAEVSASRLKLNFIKK